MNYNLPAELEGLRGFLPAGMILKSHGERIALGEAGREHP